MMNPKKRILKWVCIAGLGLLWGLIAPMRRGNCLFGEDIPFLIQIITHAVTQVSELQTIIGSAQKTASVLEEMNRGVKDVIRLADTAHLPLPAQVYENARQIDAATQTATRLYGNLSEYAPSHTRSQYRSGVEGLFLSEDAFQYSSLLDQQGRSVKNAAVVSNQATATRLAAETLGVLVHAVSHGNRIQAKALEMESTRRIGEASQEDSRVESFTKTHRAIQKDMKSFNFSPLNSFGLEP